MPRRKTSQSPSYNRPLSEEYSYEIPTKRTKTTESILKKEPLGKSSRATTPSETDDGKDEEIKTKVSNQPSLGQESSTEKRNLSLEALFQVTDNELQNISRVSPNDGLTGTSTEVNPTNISTVTVSTSEEKEEVGQQLLIIPVSEKGVEKYQLKSNSLEQQGLKLVYTKQTFAQYEPNPISYGAYKSRSYKTPAAVVERAVQPAVRLTETLSTSGKKKKDTTKQGGHICTYCGRSCAKPSVLQKHIRAHTGERPYPCVACGFSFKTKSNLYKHCKSRAHALKAGLTTTASKDPDNDVTTASTENVPEILDPVDAEHNVEEEPVVVSVRYKPAAQQSIGFKTVQDRPHSQQYAILASDKILLLNTSGNSPVQEEVSTKAVSVSAAPDEPKTNVYKLNAIPNQILKNESSQGNPAYGDHSKSTLVSANKSKNNSLQKTYFIALPKSATSVVPSIPHSLFSEGRKTVQKTSSFSQNSPSLVTRSPDFNVESQMVTKSLQSLGSISDSSSQTANTGMTNSASQNATSNNSPSVSVQISNKVSSRASTFTLQHCETSNSEQRRLINSMVGSGTPDIDNSVDGSGNKAAKPISNVMLEERIQQLISANAAIVDTPMADPPRAKKLSRQNSEVTGSCLKPEVSTNVPQTHASKPSGLSTDLNKTFEIDSEKTNDKFIVKKLAFPETQTPSDSALSSAINENQAIQIQIRLSKDIPKSHSPNVTMVNLPMIGQPSVQFPESAKGNSKQEARPAPKATSERSVIKDLLLKGVPQTGISIPTYAAVVSSRGEHAAQTLIDDSHSRNDVDGAFCCPECSMSFKKENTLALHKKYNCLKQKRDVNDALSSTISARPPVSENIITNYLSSSVCPLEEKGDESIKNMPKITDPVLKRQLISSSNFFPGIQRSLSVDNQRLSGNDSYPGIALLSKSVSVSTTVPVSSFTLANSGIKAVTNVSDSAKIGQPRVSVKGHGLRLNMSLAATAAASASSPIMTPLSTPGTPQTPGTPSSSLLKLKLKGKLLMKRSMSVERMLSQERESDSPSKCISSINSTASASGLPSSTSFSGDMYSPLKKRRLNNKEAIGEKRPLFLRTESAPCGPMDGQGDAASVFNPLKKKTFTSAEIKHRKNEDAKSAGEGVASKHVFYVPVVEAQTMIKPVQLCSLLLRPLNKNSICHNIPTTVCLEPYPGMSITLPAIVGTTATDEPVLHLPIQASKLSQWSGKNIPGTPVKIPVLKTPSTPKSNVASSCSNSGTANMTSISLGSLGTSFSTSKNGDNSVTPLYLYGHSFPSLRGNCHATYCCIQRLQPMYVRQGSNKKISMYSNWRVAPQSQNPFSLTAEMLLSLYISRYTSDPVYKSAMSSEAKNILTHSSYWDFFEKKEQQKCAITGHPDFMSPVDSGVARVEETSTETKTDVVLSTKISDESEEPVKNGQSVFQGGFKSNEDYTYVRGRGRGKFVCDACGIRCKKPSMLFKHIRTHTNVRPYSCKHCSFSFKTKGNLTKHMRSKSHLKKCLELGILPVPTNVDDSQVDKEALARQTKILSKVKIYQHSEGSATGDDGDNGNDDDFDEEDDGDMSMDLEEFNTSGDNETDGTSDVIIIPEDQDIETITVESEVSQEVIVTDMPDQSTSPLKHGVIVTDTPDQSTSPLKHGVFVSEGDNRIITVNTQSLGTIYGFPSKNTKPDLNLLVNGEDAGSNDREIARSLLDLSNQRSTSPVLQGSANDDLEKGNRLDSLIGALINRTSTCKSIGPHGHMMVNNQPQSEIPPVQPQTPVSIVQVITIDSDSEDKSNSSDGPNRLPMSKSDVNPELLPLARPNNLSLSAVEHRENPTQGVSSERHLARSISQTSLASVGPIIGQLIRQGPGKAEVSGKSETLVSVGGVVPPFHFTHPFIGGDTPLDKSNLTLPLSTQTTQEQNRPSDLDKAFENQVLMISPTKTGQNIMHLVPNKPGTEQSTDSRQMHTLGSLVGHIINVAGSSQGETSQNTQHIFLQGVGEGQSILIPIPSSLSNQMAVAKTKLEEQEVTAPLQENPQELRTTEKDRIPSEEQETLGSNRVQVTKDKAFLIIQTDPSHSQNVLLPSAGRVATNPQDIVDGRYVCTFCKKSFQQQHQLTLHKNIHYFERPYRCETCSVSFRSKGHLLKHLRSDSHLAKQNINSHFGMPTVENPRPFKCSDCQVAFRNHGHLAKHLRSKMHISMLEKVGKIPIGTYAQIEKGSLNDIDASNCERTLESLHLMIDVANESTLSQNESSITSSEQCLTGVEYDEMEDSEPDDDGALIIIESREGGQDAHKNVSTSENVMQEHFQIHNRSPYEKYKEGSNDKVTVEIKHEHFEYSEIGQGKSTPTRYGTGSDFEKDREGDTNLRSASPHLSTHSAGISDSPHKCGICRQGFKALDSLNSHLITHAELRPYVCEYCDAGFTNGQSLRIHLQTHKRERPYVCGHCGDTFAKAEDLKHHLMNHNKRNSAFFKQNQTEDCATRGRITNETSTSHQLQEIDNSFSSKITPVERIPSDTVLGNPSPTDKTGNQQPQKVDISPSLSGETHLEHVSQSQVSNEQVTNRSNP